MKRLAVVITTATALVLHQGVAYASPVESVPSVSAVASVDDETATDLDKKAFSRTVGPLVEDRVTAAINLDEKAFNETVKAVEPYLVESPNGTLKLNVPNSVRSGLSTDAYEALLYTVAFTNKYVATSKGSASFGEADSVHARGVPGGFIRPIARWVASNFGKIKAAAQASGKWAWYKAVSCTNGAVNALWNTYGQDIILLIAQGAGGLVTTASIGCIAAL